MSTPAPRVTLAPLEGTTQFAPLVALGYWFWHNDLLSPLASRLVFSPRMHTKHPLAALLDLWVSILAGCRSVSQINTRIRPDRILAQAWGRECFAEQSTVARVLDACGSEQVAQLRDAVAGLYRWMGRAPRHDWTCGPLLVDIDLTGMPAGCQAEGSTRGYFSGKKGRAAGNCAAWPPRSMMRASPRCCIPAIPRAPTPSRMLLQF